MAGNIYRSGKTASKAEIGYLEAVFWKFYQLLDFSFLSDAIVFI
jgi:hypothetical protein